MQIVKRAEVRIEGKEGTNKNLFTHTLTLTITTTTIFHFQRIQRKNIKEPQKNYPPQYTKLLSRQRRRQTAKYQQQQKQQQLNIPSRFCGERELKIGQHQCVHCTLNRQRELSIFTTHSNNK